MFRYLNIIILLYNLTFFCSSLFAQHAKKGDDVHLQFSQRDSLDVAERIKLSAGLYETDFGKAVKVARQAREFASNDKTSDAYMLANQNLGKLYFFKGKYDSAAIFYAEMLNLSQEMKDNQWQGKSYYLLGGVRLVMEDYTEALELMNEAKGHLLQHFGKESDIPLHIRLGIQNNLGVIYTGLGKFEQAAKEFRIGLKLAEEHDDNSFSYIQLLHNLGDCYYKKGDVQSSIEMYLAAERQLEVTPNGLFQSMIYNSLGNANMQLDSHYQALDYYRKGLMLARQSEGYSHLKHLTRGLSSAFEHIGVKDSALIYLKLSRAYEDSLNIKKASEKLAAEEYKRKFDGKTSGSHSLKNYAGYALLVLIILSMTALLPWLYRRLKGKVSNGKMVDVELQAELSQKENVMDKEDTNESAMLEEGIDPSIDDKERLLQLVAEEIQMAREVKGSEEQESLQEILTELRKNKSETVLADFDLKFGVVYNGFFEKLMKDYPDLTLNERRLSAFLKLQLTTKEIATVTGQSLRAIEISRTRLRKKLRLTNSDKSLTDFFLDYN